MIKVHCFVSCVCEVIKKTTGVDHRPYYFGVWDADFDMLEDGTITYHSANIDHQFFQTWYEMLYGIKIYQWYDKNKSKQENIVELERLLKGHVKHQYIMVMLDLSMLPERENKFNQKPFPHYVMLESTDKEDEWFMYDPDFRWEGILEKERIINAIKEPCAEGGFYFNGASIIPPSVETVEAYFNTCMKQDTNPIIQSVYDVVSAYTVGEQKENLANIHLALKQLPVLAIRKYAYEHAFAYFWDYLGWEKDGFEAWCNDIEQLVNGFTTIQYRAMKLAKTKDLTIAETIFEKLEEQNELEYKIKNGLRTCFNAWLCEQNNQKKKVTT